MKDHNALANRHSPRRRCCRGMVVSNEPGYYEPNDYGIRCENLMVVVQLASGMLGFETLTFAPFDHRPH